MPLLSQQDADFLRETFEKQMVNTVTIALFTQREARLLVPGFEMQAQRCAEANQIMDEVSALSDKIQLEVYDHRSDAEKLREYGIDRIPSAVLGSNGSRPARFIGVVSGYEFSTLIQDILDISTNTIELSDETRTTLEGLQEDLHLQVFVTPT